MTTRYDHYYFGVPAQPSDTLNSAEVLPLGHLGRRSAPRQRPRYRDTVSDYFNIFTSAADIAQPRNAALSDLVNLCFQRTRQDTSPAFRMREYPIFGQVLASRRSAPARAGRQRRQRRKQRASQPGNLDPNRQMRILRSSIPSARDSSSRSQALHHNGINIRATACDTKNAPNSDSCRRAKGGPVRSYRPYPCRSRGGGACEVKTRRAAAHVRLVSWKGEERRHSEHRSPTHDGEEVVAGHNELDELQVDGDQVFLVQLQIPIEPANYYPLPQSNDVHFRNSTLIHILDPRTSWYKWRYFENKCSMETPVPGIARKSCAIFEAMENCVRAPGNKSSSKCIPKAFELPKQGHINLSIPMAVVWEAISTDLLQFRGMPGGRGLSVHERVQREGVQRERVQRETGDERAPSEYLPTVLTAGGIGGGPPSGPPPWSLYADFMPLWVNYHAIRYVQIQYSPVKKFQISPGHKEHRNHRNPGLIDYP
ncbi:hypothetical protein B0H17DRAFT_1149975 [Mycena rosella]|uniref:Uncharacterized protein n=1 Tax=Mycena rosella TaxID=1033263 RepID=A0AAD7FM75_MYCRO|nr:hypothetical protein B0H17DRAFT_1149975 [Mycena rosella]